jgi:hypothetical protein
MHDGEVNQAGQGVLGTAGAALLDFDRSEISLEPRQLYRPVKRIR